MAERRRSIPVRVQVAVAIRQAMGGSIPCGICAGRLTSTEPRILEHMIPRATRIALGLDPDAPEILAWVHQSCADLKTNGPKHVKKDGDKSKIAAGTRLAEAKELHDAVVARVIERPVSSIKSRPMGHPTLRRKMNGTVVFKR